MIMSAASSEFLVVATGIVSEASLLYINYVSRVKYGFHEVNPLWKRFDRRGPRWTVLSLGLHGMFIATFWTIVLWYGGFTLLGVVVGLLTMNAFLDHKELQRVRKLAPDWSRCPRCNHFNIGRTGGICNGCEKIYSPYTQRAYGGFRP